jgi:hypothetical protein
VTTGAFAGRVFIVAGTAEVFVALAEALVGDSALVAVVSTGDSIPAAAASFRADHEDADVWQRMVPHVEQRLGPIDAVITDDAGREVADRLLGPDFRRRGHGDVVVVGTDSEVANVLRTLADTL